MAVAGYNVLVLLRQRWNVVERREAYMCIFRGRPGPQCPTIASFALPCSSSESRPWMRTYKFSLSTRIAYTHLQRAFPTVQQRI